jgi:hypothetical protein
VAQVCRESTCLDSNLSTVKKKKKKKNPTYIHKIMKNTVGRVAQIVQRLSALEFKPHY